MSRFSVIQPELLPQMQVLESISMNDIITTRLARFRELWALSDPPNAAQYDVGALEFDPIVINQECGGYFEGMLRDRVNQACRAITLVYGVGSDLEAIASRYPGGVPKLVGESDPAYRRRIWLSPNALSPHGEAESYQFWALTADSTLRDASAVTAEGTGKVYITIMANNVETLTWNRLYDVTTGALLSSSATLSGNATPTLQQIIDVRKYILAEGRKGLTDEIIVYGPKITHCNYKARVWLFPNMPTDFVMSGIETAVAALLAKQNWLGYDHSRMAFDAALAQSGVHHAVIDEPFKDVNVDDRGLVKVDMVKLMVAGTAE